MAGNWLEGTKQKRRKERGKQQSENQRNNTSIITQKGLMKKHLGMLKWETEKETKIRENDKPRVVLKKGLWAETKTTFATFAQPKTTERETNNKTPSDEKQVTTTVRHKKQTKTNKKRKEGSAKPENNSVQRGRIEERNDLK